jgi:2'-5' RNA ligase
VRLFVAIHLPDSLLQKVEALQQTLRTELRLTHARWLRRAQMHLTLRFFGEVPEAELEPLGVALKEAALLAMPAQLSLKGLGFFPNARRPRILWLGIVEERGELQRLHQAVLERTHSWGAVEDRPFQPHLTLARLKDVRPRQVRQAAELIARHSGCALGGWIMASIELMRSELSAEGPRYHSQGTYALQKFGVRS